MPPLNFSFQDSGVFRYIRKDSFFAFLQRICCVAAKDYVDIWDAPVSGRNFKGKRKVLYLDVDLYSSTLYMLSSFMPYFRKSDIIIFDEFGIELNHEFRIFVDFADMSKINYEIIRSTNNFVRVAIRIL